MAAVTEMSPLRVQVMRCVEDIPSIREPGLVYIHHPKIHSPGASVVVDSSDIFEGHTPSIAIDSLVMDVMYGILVSTQKEQGISPSIVVHGSTVHRCLDRLHTESVEEDRLQNGREALRHAIRYEWFTRWTVGGQPIPPDTQRLAFALMMGEADIDIKILMSTLSEELLKTTVQKLLYNIPGASRMAWDASNTISWSADPNQFDQHPTSYPASTVGAGNVANSLVFYQEPLIRDPLWNRMQALRLQLHSIPDKPEMIWLQIQSGVVTHAANFAEVFIPTANCDITNSPSCIVDTRTDSDLANWQTVVGQLFTDPNDFSAIRIPQTSVDTWNAPLRFGTYRKEKGFSMYIHDIVRSYRRLLLRKKIPGTIQDYGRLQLQTRTRGSYIPPSELRRAKDDIARGVQDGGLPTISSEITFQMTAEYALMAAYRPLSLATVLHEIPLHPLIQGFDGLTNEDILLLQVTIADTMRKNLHLGEKATYEEIEHCYLQRLGKPGIDEHKDISWLQLLDGLTAWTHAMDEYRRRKDLTVPMGSVLERFQWYFTMRSAIAVFKPLVPAMNNYLAQDQAMAS